MSEADLDPRVLGFRLWLSRFTPPFSLEPLRGKHYGTRVLDAEGTEVTKIWTAEGEPSVREKAAFTNWTPERWNDVVMDGHWECAADYEMAVAFIESANALMPTPEPPQR